MRAPSRPAVAAGSPDLTAARRSRELQQLADQGVDLLVVGGGITGAGVALDAAARGLRVALVERADLASGTSSRSSRLVHGGLRYLAHGDVAVAVESARERHVLMTRTAPHLCTRLGMLLPVEPVAWAGCWAGDLLRAAARTPRELLPPPRRVGPQDVARLQPHAARRHGVLAWDGQLVDDARLVVAVARTAAAHGALVLPRVRALRAGGGTATCEDVLTGERLEVRARVVVEATGAWAGRLAPTVDLRPSRGTHLVLRAAALGHPRCALHVPVPGSRSRFVFAMPNDDGTVLLALTDDPVDGEPDDVAPTVADEEWLLATLNRGLRVPVGPDDVLARFAGARPLLAAGGATADVSRRHAVVRHDDVVTVTGGKLTTYRRMAADAVDATGLVDRPSPTAAIPLVGAASRAELERLAAAVPARLVRRYGREAARVAACVGDAVRPVVAGAPVLRGEVAFAALAEGALTADDVLQRRTRLAQSAQADAAPAAVVALLAEFGSAAEVGSAADAAGDAGVVESTAARRTAAVGGPA